MEENKTELLAEAIALAARAHCGQARRDGTPYIYHPLMVAEIVKRSGASLDCQMAAVLHDTLEDTGLEEKDIARFGGNVARAVRLLTRGEGMDEADYVSAVLRDPIAKAVKEADKIHNLRECMLCSDAGFRKWYAKKAKRYYYGKFSRELDAAIDAAMGGKAGGPAAAAPPRGDIPGLPASASKGVKGRGEEFNARDPKNVFYMDARHDDSYICDPDSGSAAFGKARVYALTRDGWEAEQRDLLEEFDMYIEHTREEMDAVISDLRRRGWFHDGVETEKL